MPGRLSRCKSRRTGRPAFLPGVFQGTYVDSQHTDVEKLVEFVKNKTAPRPDQRKQLDLLAKLNQMHQAERPERPATRSPHPVVRAGLPDADGSDRGLRRDRASRSTSSKPTATASRRGALLLARRLIERGVRFVQVCHGPVQPWDSHDDLESQPPPPRGAGR